MDQIIEKININFSIIEIKNKEFAEKLYNSVNYISHFCYDADDFIEFYKQVKYHFESHGEILGYMPIQAHKYLHYQYLYNVSKTTEWNND